MTFAGIDSLKKCVSQIPPGRYPLIKFLLRFLAEMSLCVAHTNMDVPNITIVIGPNILRSSSDDPGAAMAETPLVLKVSKFLEQAFFFMV